MRPPFTSQLPLTKPSQAASMSKPWHRSSMQKAQTNGDYTKLEEYNATVSGNKALEQLRPTTLTSDHDAERGDDGRHVQDERHLESWFGASNTEPQHLG